jgi:hypothetical protein
LMSFARPEEARLGLVRSLAMLAETTGKNEVDKPTNHKARHTDLRGKPFNAKGKTTGTRRNLHYMWSVYRTSSVDGGLQEE